MDDAWNTGPEFTDSRQKMKGKMQTISYTDTDMGKKIEVRIDGRLWAIWPKNSTTQAIADGLTSPPADLNLAAKGGGKMKRNIIINPPPKRGRGRYVFVGKT
jgi:hypothetical protein